MSEEEIIEEFKELIYNPDYDEILLMTEDGFTGWHELFKNVLDLYQKEKRMYKNTGKIVKNKRDGKVGVVLREFETGQIQVLEKIGDKGGKVINTHDSWKTLEVIENE